MTKAKFIKAFSHRRTDSSYSFGIKAGITEDGDTIINFQELQIDLSARTVKKNYELIKLTSTEYYLLTLFVKNEGKVLTHQFLLRAIWGPGYINQSQYLRVFVAQIRKKLRRMQTVRSIF